MPILGTGIMPGGAIGAELTNVTRRAFIPKMVVQIYNSSPTMASLIGNSQSASGGVSSISVPVQGSQFVNAAFTDYSGTFTQPATQQGAYLSEHNLKLMVVPIPFLGMEGLVQLDHAIIPLVEARMNDSTNAIMDIASTSIFNNFSNTQQFIGLPGAVDDSTNLVTYGGINRTSNTWWKSKVYAAGSVNPTRQNVLQYICGTQKAGGEIPTFGVCGIGTWALLSQDYIGQETYMITPEGGFDQSENGPRSAFRALMVAGIPIFADFYCPEGTMYLLNSNYMSLYIHDMASFAFSGFESTIPNGQVGWVGVVLLAAELAVTKPKSCTRVGGFNSISL